MPLRWKATSESFKRHHVLKNYVWRMLGIWHWVAFICLRELRQPRGLWGNWPSQIQRWMLFSFVACSKICKSCTSKVCPSSRFTSMPLMVQNICTNWFWKTPMLWVTLQSFRPAWWSCASSRWGHGTLLETSMYFKISKSWSPQPPKDRYRREPSITMGPQAASAELGR